MAWFTPDTIAFFSELEQNNHREWFEANKKRYESSVKKPLEAFAAEMIEQMRALDPAITMLPKDAVFRIYRDTRFSKDKTPYKTNAGLAVSSASKTDHSIPGLYMHLDAKALGVGSGCYAIEPHHLKALREHISGNLAEFESLLADPAFVARFGGIRGEKNKILPPDLREAAGQQPLLFNKQFYYWAEHESETALREDLPDFLMDHMRAAWPMNVFFRKGLPAG